MGSTVLSPVWGIEPVPERLRVLGFLDTAALWGSLGVSLLVLVAGTFLVPALSLRDALIAIAVGGLVGNAMLGTAGLIGAQARVPAMVLMRPSLGHRGSYAATGLNVAQNLGWAIFELIVIATAAAALSDKVFGFEGKWLWTIVFGLLTAAMALAGPIAVVRRFVRRFALWVVLASLVYLTWWTIDHADLGAAWSQPGGGESLWYGIDLMIALPASWLPLIADYTRFSRDGRSAFAGSAIGYLIPNAWLYALGALLVTTSAAFSDPTELMTSIAAGGLAAGLALLALTVDETDEAFANVYSTAVSLQNVLPRAPQRLLIGLAATGATVGALLISWAEYETFLFLLGSFFVPLFGVLLADWLLAGRYTREDVFEAPPFRPLMIVAWLAGFCLYQWLHPTGPSAWTELLENVEPARIGASLPSFALSFVLASLVTLRDRRR
jgi:nucleobase:cation symporter-1, NCS1 family